MGARHAAGGPVILFYHDATLELMAMIRARFPGLELRHARDPEALRAMLPGADVLVGANFPAETMAAADRLRWVQTTSAGVDSLLPLRERLASCLVTNARGVHGQIMADYTMAMIGALQWQLPRLLARQSARRWQQFATAALAGRRLALVGTGAIGRAIAARAAAAGLRVTGVARANTDPAEGFERIVTAAHLHEALAEADFVVLTVPATAETAGMIDARALAAMKPGAALINIARAGVVVEAALIAALREGHLGAAVLDVFATEPLPEASPLWDIPNLIVTPHVAGYVADYDARTARILGDNLAAFLSGKPLKNLVDLSAGY